MIPLALSELPISHNLTNLQNYTLEDCFRPYIAFFSRYSALNPSLKLGNASTKTTFSRLPCKEFLMSNYCKDQPRLATNFNNIHLVFIFTTKAKVSR